MIEILNKCNTSISIGGQSLYNLRFVDDIDLKARTEAELQELTTRLETMSRLYGIKISIKKNA